MGRIFRRERVAAGIYYWVLLVFYVARAARVREQKALHIGYVMIVEVSLKQISKSDGAWVRWMKFGAFLGCHQMPSCSFFIKGYQFPICARCTGVTIGTVIAIVLFFIVKMPLWLCALLCFIMFFDWFLQYLRIAMSNNIRRLITGVAGGVGCATIQLYCYLLLFKLVTGKF